MPAATPAHQATFGASASSGPGDTEWAPVQRRTPCKDLDVPGFISDLGREKLHDLAEVRMDPPNEPGGDHERGLLVLDEVGHHLDHRVLDVVGKVGRRPIDCGLGIPLPRKRLRVELGREIAPELNAPVKIRGDERGSAKLDERATGASPQERGGCSSPIELVPARSAPVIRCSRTSPRSRRFPSISRWPETRAHVRRWTPRSGWSPWTWRTSPGTIVSSARVIKR